MGLTSDLAFRQWLLDVDAILEKAIGIGHEDCRDRNTRDAFDDGVLPIDFVEDEWGSTDDPEVMMRTEIFG